MSTRPATPNEESIQLTDLEPTGRTQYFFHCDGSNFPVRDVPGRRKTEPYIEYGYENGLNGDGTIVGAENYCNTCYPQAITSFLTSREQYLILITNPSHLSGGKMVVGYLRKADYLDRGSHYAVVGQVKLYDFEDAIPMTELSIDPPRGEAKVDADEMGVILEHFAACSDITETCLEEILRLEREHRRSNANSNCGSSGCSDSGGGC